MTEASYLNRGAFHGALFDSSDVVLDNTDFTEVTFRNSNLIYGGGPLPKLVRCNILDCEFIFDGPAFRTMQFLNGLVHGSNGGANLVVKDFLGLTNWGRTDAS